MAHSFKGNKPKARTHLVCNWGNKKFWRHQNIEAKGRAFHVPDYRNDLEFVYCQQIQINSPLAEWRPKVTQYMKTAWHHPALQSQPFFFPPLNKPTHTSVGHSQVIKGLFIHTHTHKRSDKLAAVQRWSPAQCCNPHHAHTHHKMLQPLEQVHENMHKHKSKPAWLCFGEKKWDPLWARGEGHAEGSKKLGNRSCFTSQAALLCNPFIQSGRPGCFGSRITEPSRSDAAWAAKPMWKGWLNTWVLSPHCTQKAESPLSLI